MISKIHWSDISERSNPFGGVDGFRPIRITFHSGSFTNIDDENQKALDILSGLASLDDIDAMSFDGSISQKIIIDYETLDRNNIGLKVINSEGKAVLFSGISNSWIQPNFIGLLLGIYSSNEEEKNQYTRQMILEARSHVALGRDIFVTLSNFLLENKENFEESNIYTPCDALKIIGLYLRMKGEFNWTSHVIGNATFTTSSQSFYQFLSRGLLPNSWSYLSGLGLHEMRDELITLGWSILNRYSRVLQAQDEIGRLYFMPEIYESEEKITYHFDYLTLLLTGALDAQALIINKVYTLGLRNYQCGFRRSLFKEAIRNNSATSNIDSLLSTNEEFIKILFDLRNLIHSVSLKTDFHVPQNDPDELLERLYQYEPIEHMGIQKQNLTVIVNRGDPVPSIDYAVDRFNLTHGLVKDATKIINDLMEVTNINSILDSEDVSKLRSKPPDDMLHYIDTYLQLSF